MTTIDHYSLATVPIGQFFDGTPLGNATGFVWKADSRFFLVTNWHVVSGRDFYTGGNLSPHGGRPTTLRVHFNTKRREFEKTQVDIGILSDSGEPLWLVHPTRRLDVALVPLPFDVAEPAIGLHPINTLSRQQLSVQIGMDVFILGYPFGLEPPGFPIWKRGSIASEPELARLSTDYFLVDTASRPGMSGAPVILRSWSSHLLEGHSVISVSGAPHTRFIGVYSGRRYTESPADAQLGLVWPESFLNEIVIANSRDTHWPGPPTGGQLMT